MNDIELDNYLEAGKIAKKVLQSCAAEIKPGVLVGDIFDMVVDQIETRGAMLAFPPNISLNDVAAHDSPSPNDERTFTTGDLIKLDIGTHIDGYIADTAISVNLGTHEKLCEASKVALDAAIKVVKPEMVVSEIGAAIEDAIISYGFKPIINLTGHAVARYDLHHGLSIPNTGLFGTSVLRKDDVIAIEPFATTGSGIVHEAPRAEIYQIINNTPVRSSISRKIMKKAAEMNGLPFSRRWLNIPKADLAIPTLLRQGILHVYHCLADVPDSFIAQSEHTVIVTDDGPLVTTQ
ncbi:MAG TPA: type II methionyl aminopeptidase [Methanocorpusculum sp.]|nr:type II methionyl aminopeptidase [Methanocorpusculum sp.]